MHLTEPRLLVAGLRGGSGKTLLSLGLAASFRSRGLTVAPFKKGPDYIDASWLTRAAGRPCRNLDLFLLSQAATLDSFETGIRGADLALIEGNRGLFDGMDAEGTFSSAELAKLLKAPVILSVDATKTTRTAAALVLGCQTLDPEVLLAGVVLNRVAGGRHESILRQAIEGICGVPVLGALPKLSEEIFPERHLGLVPPQETKEADDPLERVRSIVEESVDVEAVLAVARNAPHGIKNPGRVRVAHVSAPEEPTPERSRARIGIFRDAAFQFYYPENLERLVAAGGTLVEISPLQDAGLPEVDALYLGGGFPETLAVGLSENRPFMASLREAARLGLPVYAECGGAVYLGQTLHYQGKAFPLAGVLPVEYGFQHRPKGHGYTVLETVEDNPFFARGQHLRGHEFHYTFMLSRNGPPVGLEESSLEGSGVLGSSVVGSSVVGSRVPGSGAELKFAFRVHRGYGFDGEHDGLSVGNVLASYTHVHALGTVEWAPSLVRAAVGFRSHPAE